MKYNGIELKEFTSDKTVILNPPKEMLVWDLGDVEPCKRMVMAYVPGRTFRPVITRGEEYSSCAEIPEEPKPRRATNLELMKWLAQGKGYCNNILSSGVWATYEFDADIADKPCFESFRVRKWEDKEWHEPTADYMGLEG